MHGNRNKQRIYPFKNNRFFFFGPFVVLLLLMPALLARHTLAKVWEADPLDPNKQIQKMIDRASPGDTVLLSQGIYYVDGNINLREGITLAGMEDEPGAVVLSGDPYNPDNYIICAKSHTCMKNLVIQHGIIGIYCSQGTSHITIDHNLIIQNGYGISASLTDNLRILSNTIVHNDIRGIIVHIDPDLPADPNRPILYGQENIIGLNGCDIEFFQIIADPNSLNAYSAGLTNVFLSHNNLFNKVFRFWIDGNYNEIARKEISNFGVFGPGNFSANPCFVDVHSGDYHLASYSPCIDRGDPNSDFSLEPPPNNGQRVNLGFYGNTPQAALTLDSDSDGPFDYQEGAGDVDKDGLPDWQDSDTVSLPLPGDSMKISLHIQDIICDSNQTVQFREAGIVSPSDPDQAIDLPQGVMPFEVIQFRAIEVNNDMAIVRMYLPKGFDAMAVSRYLALSAEGSWQPLAFEIDPNEMAITLQIMDGAPEDRDGLQNGAIEHLACLVIPQSISLENPGSCFISRLNTSRLQAVDFWAFLSVISSQVRDLKTRLFVASPSLCPVLRFIFGMDIVDHLQYRSRSAWCLHNKRTAFLSIFSLYLAIGIICFLVIQKGAERKRLFTLSILLLMLLSFSRGWAQIQEDIEITSSPNPIGSGARALGMGGAFIGVADDATAASWNPAGLKHLVRPEISWVEAYSSRRESYRIGSTPMTPDDQSLSQWDVNYLSLACPGRLLKRNFVASLNYQHLYDFSRKLSHYGWQLFSEDPYLEMNYQASYEQSGGLQAVSPALAVLVNPWLSLGLTINIWSDQLSSNEWVEKYHKDGQGVIGSDHQSIITHVDVLERYTFSGLNYNLGLLWDIGETLTLGAVYKASFRADLEHTNEYYKIEEYPDEPASNQYIYDRQRDKERLAMPASYGLGLAWQPIDPLVIDLDIYRTEWGDYELIHADGRRTSPITGFNASEVKVKPTHQVRLGAEYAFMAKKGPIPISTLRAGAFYDPAPAPGHPDDYYGLSLGLGMTLREQGGAVIERGKRRHRKDIMSLDMAYQYRWGRKIGGDIIKGENLPQDIDHHLVYLSIIYYI